MLLRNMCLLRKLVASRLYNICADAIFLPEVWLRHPDNGEKINYLGD